MTSTNKLIVLRRSAVTAVVLEYLSRHGQKCLHGRGDPLSFRPDDLGEDLKIAFLSGEDGEHFLSKFRDDGDGWQDCHAHA